MVSNVLVVVLNSTIFGIKKNNVVLVALIGNFFGILHKASASDAL